MSQVRVLSPVPLNRAVAPTVERRLEELGVIGSNPICTTKKIRISILSYGCLLSFLCFVENKVVSDKIGESAPSDTF